jgi:molybdopterin adenylyltransferase
MAATHPAPGGERPRIGILTVSDRASSGAYEDRSGPAIEEALRAYLATPCDYVCRLVPDEVPQIAAALRELAESGCGLICTTGGTGPAPRDVTPEAMEAVCDKLLPGFGELMRRTSLDAGVPTAILSRQTAGVIGQSLVVNLPGKPGSIRVCLDAVFPAIPYCVDLVGGPYLEGDPAVVRVFRPK